MRFEKRFSWQWSKSSSDRLPVPLGLIFLLVGLGMLVGSIWAYQKDKQFAESAVAAQGTVIDLIKKRSRQSDSQGFSSETIMYAPVVQFIDQRGQIQLLHATGGSNPPTYRRGEIVTVLYEPDNPEFAVIDNWERYYLVLFLSGMGLLFTLLGLLALWIAITVKRKKSQDSNEQPI